MKGFQDMTNGVCGQKRGLRLRAPKVLGLRVFRAQGFRDLGLRVQGEELRNSVFDPWHFEPEVHDIKGWIYQVIQGFTPVCFWEAVGTYIDRL